jgi:hypothetical protein
MYISQFILDCCIFCTYQYHDAQRDLTSIKLTVTYFMGTAVFLIRYSIIQNKHFANWRCSMIVIKNIISLIKKISKLQSSHYTSIYTGPMRTGGESLWIQGTRFGNHWSSALIFCDVTTVNFKNITILWSYTILLQISANWERLYDLFLLLYIKHKTINLQEKPLNTCMYMLYVSTDFSAAFFVKCAMCAVQPTDSKFVPRDLRSFSSEN